MSNKEGQRRTLGDIINDKITEKKTEIDTHFSGYYHTNETLYNVYSISNNMYTCRCNSTE